MQGTQGIIQQAEQVPLPQIKARQNAGKEVSKKERKEIWRGQLKLDIDPYAVLGFQIQRGREDDVLFGQIDIGVHPGEKFCVFLRREEDVATLKSLLLGEIRREDFLEHLKQPLWAVLKEDRSRGGRTQYFANVFPLRSNENSKGEREAATLLAKSCPREAEVDTKCSWREELSATRKKVAIALLTRENHFLSIKIPPPSCYLRGKGPIQSIEEETIWQLNRVSSTMRNVTVGSNFPGRY